MILTPQQQAVVKAEGEFLLLACPGSGKTRSAAERAARLVGTSGRKVAVCSYTNVGVERIGAVLAGELGIVLARKHFLGTIHQFLLAYVVRPFAHLLGAERGPFIHEGRGWPEVCVYGDNRQRIRLDCFRRMSDGGLLLTDRPRSVKGTSEEIVTSVGAEVLRRKGEIFRGRGVLTSDDAMWVALHLLRERADVAAAVAARFDEILLDEAQDTSELQLACLDQLHATGRLASLVLVGDLEQSIFSFQGASAARCQRLATDHGLDILTLTENHRSSQRICDVAVNFCSRTEPDTAVGPHATCSIPPEVTLYPANDPRAAMDIYRGRLAEYGLGVDDAAVLGRYWSVVDLLNGQTTLFESSDRRYVIGQLAARLASGTLTASDVRNAQRLLAYCAWDTTLIAGLSDQQQADLRRATSTLLGRLPRLEGNLRSWLIAARGIVHEVAASLTEEVKHTGGRTLTAPAEFATYQAAEVYSSVPPDLRARTVHSFKGEDSDAVMVVIGHAHASVTTSQLDLWEAAVAGVEVDPEKAEERRVLFVALTRARRYCLVALPDDPRGRAIAAACDALGFDSVDGM